MKKNSGRVASAGSRRTTRRETSAEHAPSGAPRGSSTEAPRKLRGSSAHPQLCSKLQGVVVVIPSKNLRSVFSVLIVPRLRLNRGTILGVPFSGRLGTPNPDTRFCTSTLLYLDFTFYLLTFTHFLLTTKQFYSLLLIFYSLYPLSFHFTYFTHFTHFIHLLTLLLTLLCCCCYAMGLTSLLERRGFEPKHAPSGAPRRSSAKARQKLRESSAEAQLIHSYAARCMRVVVVIPSKLRSL